MKNILLIFIIIFTTGKLSAEQYFFISGLNITQINESQIKVNVKIDGGGFTDYNSYTTETIGNVVTLKVCYDHYLFDGGQAPNNDFYIDISSASDNYTLKVEIYRSTFQGCLYQASLMQDSATLDFTTPFTGTISLSTNDLEQKNKNIDIFPNPVKDILHFSEEVSSLIITDLSGKIERQSSAPVKSIDVSKLSKGTYFITFTMKSGAVISKKLVKE